MPYSSRKNIQTLLLLDSLYEHRKLYAHPDILSFQRFSRNHSAFTIGRTFLPYSSERS